MNQLLNHIGYRILVPLMAYLMTAQVANGGITATEYLVSLELTEMTGESVKGLRVLRLPTGTLTLRDLHCDLLYRAVGDSAGVVARYEQSRLYGSIANDTQDKLLGLVLRLYIYDAQGKELSKPRTILKGSDLEPTTPEGNIIALKAWGSIGIGSTQYIREPLFLSGDEKPAKFDVSIEMPEFDGLYSVDSIKDDFDGYSIERMRGNKLTCAEDSGSISLNAQRYTSKSGKTVYSLVVIWESGDWLFIRNGESLVLLIDGKRVGLRGAGSGSNRIVGSGITEGAWYDVSYVLLQRIVKAKEVRIKVSGSQSFVERCLSPENIKALQRFIKDYPPPAPKKKAKKAG